MSIEAFAILFLIGCCALLAFGIWCERKSKRNRRTRDGWNVPTRQVHDASCKSGWHNNVQRGTRY